MVQSKSEAQVIVGPRSLENRICRLVYRPATDEVWAEEWQADSWVRANALVRLILKAPPADRSKLEGQGVRSEPGIWDLEEVAI